MTTHFFDQSTAAPSVDALELAMSLISKSDRPAGRGSVITGMTATVLHLVDATQFEILDASPTDRSAASWQRAFEIVRIATDTLGPPPAECAALNDWITSVKRRSAGFAACLLAAIESSVETPWSALVETPETAAA